MNYTLIELRRRNIDKHIYLLNEDWNEPDDWETDLSSVYVTGMGDEIIYVLTPTRMRYRAGFSDAPKGWGPWTESVVLAVYRFENPDPISVIVYDDQGKIAYNTITGESQRQMERPEKP